jgi:hypothetical protein
MVKAKVASFHADRAVVRLEREVPLENHVNFAKYILLLFLHWCYNAEANSILFCNQDYKTWLIIKYKSVLAKMCFLQWMSFDILDV